MERKFMERAVWIAKRGAGWTNPNPMVGAVIVKEGEIIGEGWHERIGGLHAERNALKNCKKDPEGADLYVTLEPCCHYGKTPPCTDAIIRSGIKRVYIGCLDPNPKVAGKGAAILKENEIEVMTGIMEKECRELNDVFFYYIQHDMPYVALKYAMTLDGKIATRTGESKWITGDEARRHTHRLRHRYAAIMAGIGTVIADDPMLNARIEHASQPVRVICDSRLRIPETAKVVETAKEIPTIIAMCSGEYGKIQRLEKAGCRVWKMPEENGHVSFKAVLRELRKQEIDSVLIEGGGVLNEAVVKSGCVNYVHAYIAPKIIGGESAKTPVEGEGIAKLTDALTLEHMKIKKIGEDALLEGKVKPCLPES